MMFLDNGHSLTPSGDQNERYLEELVDGIANDELRGLTSDFLLSCDEARQGLVALAIEPRYRSVEPALSQERVDDLITGFIGKQAFQGATEKGQLFAEGDRRYIRDDGVEESLLRNVLGLSTFVESDSRRVRRRVGDKFDKYGKKAKALVDYLEETPHLLAEEQIKTISQAVSAAPSALGLADRSEAVGSLSEAENPLSRLDEKLAILAEVDTSTDFATLKMILFSNIADIYKHPVIRAAYKKNYEDDDNTAEIIDKNKFGPYAHAAFVVGELNNLLHAHGEMATLSKGHSALRSRFFHIPSKEFRDTLHRLDLLLKAYEDIQNVEADLQATAETAKTFVNSRQALVRAEAIKLSRRAGKNISSFLKRVIDSDIFQEHHTDDATWQDILRAEAATVAVASGLSAQLKQPALGLKNGEKKALGQLCEPKFDDEKRKYLLELHQQELKPTIGRLVSEFLAIDEPYRLTNKRLRERLPNLFTIAKKLSEQVIPREPLDDNMTRYLVGLMAGVYWERTGQNKTAATLTETYVKDTRTLRELGAQLDELRHPQSSRFLTAINLLDEIIDSGFFDNINKDDQPELACFLDFVKTYNIARGYVTEETEEPQEAPVELELDTEEEFQIPIEALRQATAEDLLVFPPSATASEVIQDYKERVPAEDLPLIEWGRIVKVIELRDQLAKQNLEVNFIRTKHASWQVLPFFILEARLPRQKHAVAVIESPVYGNATYTYREGEDRFEWRDVVQCTRQQARELGAVPAVHVDGQRLDLHFKKIWNRVISELTING